MMPPPPQKPYWFDTAGLSAEQIAGVDPDYLHFLRHVRLEAGSYTLEIPSRDGASPPLVVRYEQPIAGPNAEAAAVDGSENGNLDAPSPVEMESSAAAEVPSGGVAPLPVPVDVTYGEGEHLAGPNAEAPDDDGSEHRDLLGVPSPVEMGSAAAEVPASGATPLPVVDQVVDAPVAVEAAPAWYDSIEGIDESYRLFLERSSAGAAVNHAPSPFEMGDVSASLDEAVSANTRERHEVDEEEEEGHNEEEAKEGQKEGHESEREERSDEGQTQGHDDKQKDGHEDEEERVKKVEEVEEQKEEHQVQEEEEHEEKDLECIIWPTHIIERQESEFKQKLIKALTTKPFSRDEYDKLFAMAIKRSPITKERRTRHHEMSYIWPHELGKSYFDNYPDLADQVNGESSYPKRLALLRGFFFWLENVAHDDQFKPWSDAYKTYRVTYIED